MQIWRFRNDILNEYKLLSDRRFPLGFVLNELYEYAINIVNPDKYFRVSKLT